MVQYEEGGGVRGVGGKGGGGLEGGWREVERVGLEVWRFERWNGI